MKSLKSLILLGTSILSISAYANPEATREEVIKGPKAQSLVMALEEGGAKASVWPGAYHLNTDQIRCSQGFAMGRHVAQCSVVQFLSGPRGPHDLQLVTHHLQGVKAKHLMN